MESFDWVNPFWNKPSTLTWDVRHLDSTAKAFVHLTSGLAVIVSGMVEGDGKRWLHVSVSRAGRLPSWEDLGTVKNEFIGKDKVAIQVFPTEDKYVNFHPHVLHLWHCVDGESIPDFTFGRAKGML
jgi:hypothetical protein